MTCGSGSGVPMTEALPVLVVVVPLLWGASQFLFGSMTQPVWPLLGAAVTTLLSVLLVRAVAVSGPLEHVLGGWAAPLGIRLAADGLSAVMILLATVTGALVSLHAAGLFAGQPDRGGRFWSLWLMLWGALNALFLSADLFNIYVALELVTLTAIPMVLLAGTAKAVTAALNYLLFALFGSLLYLAGVALIYGQTGTLDLALVAQRLDAGSGIAGLAGALMLGGVLVKAAILPFHVWLPPAHGSAPAPVSAVLSALVVKAAVYLLLRLWTGPLDALAAPVVGQSLGLLGAAAIFHGSIQAMRQERLKLVVAYSTVAQLGYMLLFFPLAGGLAWQGAVYHGLSHGLAKAAMFLAVGNMLYHLGHDRVSELRGMGQPLAMSLAAFGIAGISIMGLPPSGGFVGKWLLLRAALESGAWWWALVVIIGGLLAAGYMFRVLRYAFMEAHAGPSVDREPTPESPVMIWSAMVLAVLAVTLGFMGVPLLALLGSMPGEGGP